ncbi:MAG: hypothetical protein HQL71_06665 [Magnetococcales bacterium]|nr:hypothetical protein [Magnetococcales bacterium]
MNEQFSLKQLLIFFVLSALGVVGNYLNIKLFFGVDFIFGSIAALIAVRILGVLPGAAIAFIGGGFTYFLWGHPYAAIIFTVEVLTVGLLMQYLPKHLRYLALADLIYWILLGAPLVFLFYSNIMEMSFSQTSLIALKQPVNGIMNALIAALVVVGIDFILKKQRIPIGTILFNVITAGVYVTAISLTTIYAYPMKGNAEVGIENELVTIAKIAAENRRSDVDLSQLGPEIIFAKAPMDNLIHINGSLYVNLTLNKGPAMKRWKQADYVVQLPLYGLHGDSTHVIVKKNASQVINNLHQLYVRAFIILAIFSLLAIFCAAAVTGWLLYPLQNLAKHSQNLPERIEKGETPQIPDSPILESNQFANDFRNMAERLRLSFTEITAANDKLEKRVEERTKDLKLALDESQIANNAKSDFISNVSHELRTPLTSILGSLKLIQGGVVGEVNSKIETLLGTAIRNGDRLLNLVNDILDFSKLEAGKMKLTTQPVKAVTVIDSVIESTEGLIKEKGLSLNYEVGNDITVLAEAKRVEQILINIIGNAVKFTQSGEIVIKSAINGKFAEFSVSDTGCGIPEDKLSIIFDSFSQADTSSTRKAGGTGLGLAISEHFVRLHGGRIWVESKIDEGSTFKFTIPLV